ncbi:23S rRNA (guanosine(2251)-2'-O)-methyltransferase RlmB [Scatolibacter rhodanostii]|uniref:23S rRNA (guanosine(2251)-2'-O)-methyltransferase RlmB n=1 Tax=Scatolibacter rhodanostii TaxID=2014781 RepID=UPI001FA8C39F|nr:23S rRNA (guanosine(2251)-2'-O)-methyltransferase RlmB [Scatolibacter rhodanostii]
MDNHENNIIAGRNAVSEALRAGRPIAALYVLRGEKNGSIVSILARAKQKEIPIKEVDLKKLDFMCGHAVHQGVVAAVAVKDYADLDDLFRLAEERGEPPFFILCDELSDPYNLGAIIRTAECAGAHGVIVPKRRNVGLTFAVGKSSAGAVEYLPVARVTNLADTIETLKKRGVWIYTADMDGQPWCQTDFSGAVALVIGSEGEGVSRLIKEKSDFIVSLPMKGKINSLNASVAAGILSYEISRQRSRLNTVNP